MLDTLGYLYCIKGGEFKKSASGIAFSFIIYKSFLFRLNVDTEDNVQVLPVATHLPPGYLSIQPLGLGKGVRVRSNCFFSY